MVLFLLSVIHAFECDDWWWKEVAHASCLEMRWRILENLMNSAQTVERIGGDYFTPDNVLRTIETNTYSSPLEMTEKCVFCTLRYMAQVALLVLSRKECFDKAFRMKYLESMLWAKKLEDMHFRIWWYTFESSNMSEFGNPGRHLSKLQNVLEVISKIFKDLAELSEIDDVTSSDNSEPGHFTEGMFDPTKILERHMFPDSSMFDLGVARSLLRILPFDSTVADLGAFDGRYTSWLNDSGLIQAQGFDGIPGIEALTKGVVKEVDLSKPMNVTEGSFDYVLCVEVAEHIPAHFQESFLNNLRIARKGLIISWALPGQDGEGHVNCQAEEVSRALIEALGFRRHDANTKILRKNTKQWWIATSIAFYDRV